MNRVVVCSARCALVVVVGVVCMLLLHLCRVMCVCLLFCCGCCVRVGVSLLLVVVARWLLCVVVVMVCGCSALRGLRFVVGCCVLCVVACCYVCVSCLYMRGLRSLRVVFF